MSRNTRVQRGPPALVLHRRILRPDPEAVAACERLLDDAREGRLVGMALVALGPDRGYCVEAIGGCHRDPTYALGAAASLSAELLVLVDKQARERV